MALNSSGKLRLSAAALILSSGLVVASSAQEKTLKIGVLTDMSSVSADIMGAGSVLAAQMAVEDMGGSVAGMKIEIIGGDHQQKPDVGVAVARRWIEQNQVDAIVDIPNTSVALAINQVAREANIVFMPASSGGLALTGAQCSPNTVRWTQDVWAGATSIPKALMEGGANKTWYWIRPDVAFGADTVKYAGETIERLGGKVVGTVAHPVGTTDFSSFALQAKSSGANVIGVASFSDDLTNILKVSGEFGVMRGGQKIASNILTINNVRAAGLDLELKGSTPPAPSIGISTIRHAPLPSATTRGIRRRSWSTSTPPASTGRCAITSRPSRRSARRRTVAPSLPR